MLAQHSPHAFGAMTLAGQGRTTAGSKSDSRLRLALTLCLPLAALELPEVGVPSCECGDLMPGLEPELYGRAGCLRLTERHRNQRQTYGPRVLGAFGRVRTSLAVEVFGV